MSDSILILWCLRYLDALAGEPLDDPRDTTE